MRAFATLGLACALLTGGALAADGPALKPGQWSFKRTMSGPNGPHELATSRCADPAADMKARNAMLAKAGCTVSPVAVSGNVYRFSADCTIQGVKAHSETALTVESGSAYTVHVTTTGTIASEETLVARRTGDCPK